jgi:hypothetical protein
VRPRRSCKLVKPANETTVKGSAKGSIDGCNERFGETRLRCPSRSPSPGVSSHPVHSGISMHTAHTIPHVLRTAAMPGDFRTSPPSSRTLPNQELRNRGMHRGALAAWNRADESDVHVGTTPPFRIPDCRLNGLPLQRKNRQADAVAAFRGSTVSLTDQAGLGSRRSRSRRRPGAGNGVWISYRLFLSPD